MRRAWIGFVLCASLLFAAPAGAATIDVPCGGPSALVQAVADANSQPGADVIALASRCTYTFTAPDNNWFGPNALPAIASEIVIDGNGSIIERSSSGGTPPFRLFFVGADAADPDTNNFTTPGAGSLTLRDVTLRNGYAKGGDGAGGGGGMGGAIFSMGKLTLLRVTAFGNTARGGNAVAGVIGGGGMGEDGSATAGDGFGGTIPSGVGAAGGVGDLDQGVGGAGGGAGFRDDEPGLAGSQGGNGGGPNTGLGGGSHDALPGDGSGGGGDSPAFGQTAGGAGGAFGRGGLVGTPTGFFLGAGGGGGGVGGGGAPGATNSGGGGGVGDGGGGGFGGGGGAGSTGSGGTGYYGSGGFGGGDAGEAGDGYGGAIFNLQGEVSIDRSTFTQNRAVTPTTASTSRGGGGALFNLNGTVSITDSTFGFNVSGGESGGVVSNGFADAGGSIYNLGLDDATMHDVTVVLRRSVVGRSVPQTFEVYSDEPAAPSSATNMATVYLGDHNVIFNPGSSGPGGFLNSTDDGHGNTSSFVEPQLGQLGTYRAGLTPVLPPKPGSVALNFAGNGCATTDQVGQARPAGAGCEAGAVEVVAPANDNFAAAQQVLGTPASLPGDTMGATSESVDNVKDVWYRWTAGGTGAASAQACPTTSASVEVLTGPSVDNLTSVASASGSTCGAATAAFSAVSGTTYYFRVSSQDGEPFTLNVTGPGSADTTAPDTTIDSGPTGTIAQGQPSFTFHSSEPASSFECSLDQGTPKFAACNGTYTPAAPLAGAAYTFRVRAKDAAGNTDDTPATRTFTVDTTAPTATIDSGPSGLTNQPRPTFGFHLSEPGTTECSIDQGTPNFAACSGGVFQPGSNLADGAWTFRVRGTDAFGNAGSAVARSFSIETQPPDIGIASGPPNTIGPTDSATFTFISSAQDLARFECRLDDAVFAACTSPATYSELATGAHTFRVRAVDNAGNTSADALREFTVQPAGAATPTPSTTPPATGLTFAAPCTRPVKIRALLKARGCATTATAPRAGTLTITWRRGKTVIASGKATVRAAGRVTVTVRLTKRGRTLLAKARQMKLTATAVLGTLSARRTFTLKR